MEFLTARELRLNPKEVWKRTRKDRFCVITLNGKPQFLLSPIESDELEEVMYFLRRVRAEMALESMSGKAKEKGLDKLSLDEINKVISEVRRKKNAGSR